ncbi:selenide, water dikinase SelD, partial [candidate division KSB1 bacterium]|nr:selenide, water dikinase SelD [candidate division KSB1 bacterium]NIR72388.1 selenide, water dikinase SelD [candidate division KSB1 bacterium]NIS26731.1 selenide, water dikinase SelD [candidate division KSB1 bacterium]NIT70463.1 selenide, water dikinase SelD [candidate division KSB1 bacterium]NIU24161.1 selenide, water dikinase SelD [candidate division KSB1 bacterium]
MPKPNHPDLLVGVNTIDDAGVFRLNGELALVQTVDFFTPIVDDPYTYGAIAAANSLSDVYAMGGEPVTALNIVCYPRKTIKPEILSDILKGGHDKAMEAGCVIVGGHSVEDDEMKYGLAVTGKINTTNILKNSNAQPGDALVLTKPLGTGIATTAFKLGSISDQLYESVAQSMLRLNANSSKLAVEFGAHACTDVTGFGLLGHAWGMANASEVGLVLYSHEIPTFDGIENLAAQGFLTRGDVDNREYLGGYIEIDKKISEDLVRVLYDPQTSGGLLISVSAEVADELVSNIEKQG